MSSFDEYFNFLITEQRSAYLGLEDGNLFAKPNNKRKLISKIFLERMRKNGVEVPDDSYEGLSHSIKNLPSQLADKLSLVNLAPPPGIQWLGRKKGLFFDIRTADDFEDCIDRSQFNLRDGCKYLDFGCASGRTLRTFASALPECDWYGCDPVPSSMKWASSTFPNIKFFTNPELPPLDIESDTFDGIYAASIWTHFREDVALQWFDEMYRILKPYGFLLFTAAGYQAVLGRYKGDKNRSNNPIHLESLLKLDNKGFFFYPAYEEKGMGDLNTSHWGLAWIVVSLSQ